MHGEPKIPARRQTPEYVNPDAPKGGSVKFGAQGTYDSLHPFILKGVAATGIGQLWETLCWHSRDEAFTVYGLIAETIECPTTVRGSPSTCGRRRNGIDGTPITVEDVIWSFETLKAKGLPRYASYYADVLKVEKTDDRKVRFTFRDATNRELPLILGQLPVLPSKWWDGKEFEKVDARRRRLSSGPYKVDSFDIGRSITYRRVPELVGEGSLDEPRPQQFRDDALRLLSRQRRAVRGLQGGRHRPPASRTPAATG